MTHSCMEFVAHSYADFVTRSYVEFVTHSFFMQVRASIVCRVRDASPVKLWGKFRGELNAAIRKCARVLGCRAPYLVTRLIHMCDLTHFYVCIYNCMCVNMCGKWARSLCCRAPHRVTWLIHMCDMTHSCMCDESHAYLRSDWFVCGIWGIHIRDTTQLYQKWAHVLCCCTWWHDTRLELLRLEHSSSLIHICVVS